MKRPTRKVNVDGSIDYTFNTMDFQEHFVIGRIVRADEEHTTLRVGKRTSNSQRLVIENLYKKGVR